MSREIWSSMSVFRDKKQTPWPESASELCRPRDHRLSAKLVLTLHCIIGWIGTNVSEEFLVDIFSTSPQDGGSNFLENVKTYPPNYMSRTTLICHIFRIYLAVRCEGNVCFLQKWIQHWHTCRTKKLKQRVKAASWSISNSNQRQQYKRDSCILFLLQTWKGSTVTRWHRVVLPKDRGSIFFHVTSLAAVVISTAKSFTIVKTSISSKNYI
jgi:hypothetical protein